VGRQDVSSFTIISTYLKTLNSFNSLPSRLTTSVGAGRGLGWQTLTTERPQISLHLLFGLTLAGLRLGYSIQYLFCLNFTFPRPLVALSGMACFKHLNSLTYSGTWWTWYLFQHCTLVFFLLWNRHGTGFLMPHETIWCWDGLGWFTGWLVICHYFYLTNLLSHLYCPFSFTMQDSSMLKLPSAGIQSLPIILIDLSAHSVRGMKRRIWQLILGKDTTGRGQNKYFVCIRLCFDSNAGKDLILTSSSSSPANGRFLCGCASHSLCTGCYHVDSFYCNLPATCLLHQQLPHTYTKPGLRCFPNHSWALSNVP
jgi:hypothetical protein